MTAKTITVNKWGGTLGVRLPREYVEKTGIVDKAKIETKIVGNTLVLSLPNIQRTHIPLAARMEKARIDGTWHGVPAELTQEDRDWLEMPSVGEELEW